jgi:hypothetical protein
MATQRLFTQAELDTLYQSTARTRNEGSCHGS